MPKTYSPREFAEWYAIDHGKVLRWIDAGQLKAINVASNPNGQPRWRIPEESRVEFEQARANVAPPKPSRRRTAAAVERKYY